MGRLAEALGPEEFYRHMRNRMAGEPLAERTGTVVQRLDDPAGILIGDMLHGPQGVLVKPLHAHRFASSLARDAFYD